MKALEGLGESLPERNVFWRDIPTSSTVKIRGLVFLVELEDGDAVAYWTGEESREAQAALDRMVAEGKT